MVRPARAGYSTGSWTESQVCGTGGGAGLGRRRRWGEEEALGGGGGGRRIGSRTRAVDCAYKRGLAGSLSDNVS
jgi:hypothetical protein